MRKYFSKILIFILLVTILISSQIVFAAEIIFNNDHLRFGSGFEPSINNSGNLKQPFYFNGSIWRQLTYYDYPLDFEIGEGGDGTSWWNINSEGEERKYNPELSDFTLDSTGFTSYEEGTKGYGTLITNGTVTINGKNIQINNKYELSQEKSFIKVTTKFTNKSESTVSNLRYWVGTRDDYVGGSDSPTKEKGNLTDGKFDPISNQSTTASALRLSTDEEGVLFYTDTDKANIIVGESFGWTNVLNRNPVGSPITVNGDDSYAFYVRLNDLEPDASDEIVWYYAAGLLTDLEDIVRDVAAAAASVFNIESKKAEFRTSSEVSGTVYYMVIPSNSTAPTAGQIESGEAYDGVEVIARGYDSLTAGGEKTFTLEGLEVYTGYDLYIVVKDNEGKYSSIAKNSFTTAKVSNTITFVQPADKIYGDKQFLLEASADSKLPLSYTSSNTNVATVDTDGRVTIIGAGTTHITASQAGNDYFAPATSVMRILTVDKKDASVTPNPKTKIYGDDDPALDGELTDFLAEDNITASYSREAGESVNTYSISAVLNPAEALNNYNIKYNIADFIIEERPISVKATADGKTYDGTVNSVKIPVITEGTLASGENAILEQIFINKNVGTDKTLIPTCKIYNELDSETTSNYDITVIQATGEIIPAIPTISLADKTSNYTGSPISIEPAAVTGVLEEIPSGDITYTYYIDRACTTLTTPANSGASANGQAPVYAGTYFVKATIAATQNYSSQTTAAPGTLIVLPADGDTLSIGSNLTKTYGDESFMLTATGGSGTGTVSYVSSNPNVASVTLNGYVTINSVGETTISATKASDGNYDSQSASIVLTVNRKTVAYTISNNNKTYTGLAQYANVSCDNPSLTVGSDYSITYYQSDNVVESPIEPGVYRIVVTTINNNYEGSIEGTLTITNAGQIDFGIGGIPHSVKYEDSFTLYPIGNINGTTTYEIVSGNATVNTDTGLVEIIGIGEVVVKATNTAANFEIKTAIASFTVQPKTITITALAIDRDYEEGNYDVDVELITGLDGVTAACTSATMATDDAGVDKLVTVTGITLDSVNYKPESTTIYTRVTIGRIPAGDSLAITGLPSSITYEDADFRLTATGQGRGKVIWTSSDRTVARINSSTGLVTIKGAGRAVITATKESDGNYEEVSSSITIEVNKKDVTYSIINNTKVYNGSVQNATITPSAISLVKDVDYKVTYSQDGIEVDEPIEAGVYGIYVETLNNNYEGNSTGATLTILEANQTSPLVIGGLPSYIEYEDSFALYANGGNGEGNVYWAIESGSEYAEVTSGSGIVSIRGVGRVTVSATKDGDGNYKDQVASVTFTTNKKQINVVISNTLKTYNGLEQSVTIKATPTSYSTFENLAEISYVNQADGAETEFKNVGTYNVLVDVNDAYSEYYELSGSLSAVATIKKADLIISADNKSVNYGKSAPTFTFSIDGFMGNDGLIDLMGSPVFSCDYRKGSAAGEYEIKVSGFTSSNYSLEYVPGKLTVLPALSSGGSSGSGSAVKPVEPIVDEIIYDNPFDDVNEDDWFYEAVEYVNIAGLMSGTGETTFKPYLDTTRSMIVTILYRMEKEPGIADINTFNDITIDSWYYDAIAWGAENGVVKGYDNETFGPNDKITREQLAAILYRYAMLKGYIVNEPVDLSIYQDYEKMSSWGIDSMQWAVSQGIITGTSPNTLDPQGYATRAQTAACLMRFIQNILK